MELGQERPWWIPSRHRMEQRMSNWLTQEAIWLRREVFKMLHPQLLGC